MFIFCQIILKPLDEPLFLWFIELEQTQAVPYNLLYRRHRLCNWAFM